MLGRASPILSISGCPTLKLQRQTLGVLPRIIGYLTHRTLGVSFYADEAVSSGPASSKLSAVLILASNCSISVRSLVLLRHKVSYFARFLIEAAQQGHRRKCLTRTRTSRRRMVAIEFGMCRSGRSGGSSGSVTFGNARRLEHRGGTRC
jgi:hypothetical protein